VLVTDATLSDDDTVTLTPESVDSDIISGAGVW